MSGKPPSAAKVLTQGLLRSCPREEEEEEKRLTPPGLLAARWMLRCPCPMGCPTGRPMGCPSPWVQHTGKVGAGSWAHYRFCQSFSPVPFNILTSSTTVEMGLF